MRLSHCGKKRPTTQYWMISAKAAFDWEIIAQATCQKCNKTILEYYGLSLENGLKFIERVRHRQHTYWQERMIHDVVEVFKDDFLKCRNTRAATYASEYTLRASRDTALSHGYVLRLQKSKAG